MDNIFHSSGFLIQEINEVFSGFDGLHGQDVWPLYFEDLNSELTHFLNKHVLLETVLDDWVDLCTDINFVHKYYIECQNRRKEIEILFCRTPRKNPTIPQSLHDLISVQSEFLGFDYAYPGSDYYSAVFEDVFTKRIELFNGFYLNRHGLFQKLETVNDFSIKRNLLMQNPEYNFEQGKFIFYEIWRVNPEIFDSL